MTLREQLPALAAAEAHGDAAMQVGDDATAATMFRISEAADALFLALVRDDVAGELAETLVERAPA